MPAAISRAASYSIELGTRIPCCPSASYTSSSTGKQRAPVLHCLDQDSHPFPLDTCGADQYRTFWNKEIVHCHRLRRRIRSACPSDTVCVPCTQAAMVFLPEVWHFAYRGVEAGISLACISGSNVFIACRLGRVMDTIRFCTRFTGRTAVRSFRLFGALAVEEASGCFPRCSGQPAHRTFPAEPSFLPGSGFRLFFRRLAVPALPDPYTAEQYRHLAGFSFRYIQCPSERFIFR